MFVFYLFQVDTRNLKRPLVKINKNPRKTSKITLVFISLQHFLVFVYFFGEK